jgi:hypothetical protein
MDETSKKQKTETKRKLTLNRETLRTLDNKALNLLDGVVGGTGATDYGADSRFQACFEP